MIQALLALALVPAHPLGNFSVNQLAELTLHPDKVSAVATLDLAELPTLQHQADAANTCADFARDLVTTVDGKRLTWQITASTHTEEPGAAGLRTSRFTCDLVAQTDLSGTTQVTVANRHLPERVGWRELTARGAGVAVDGLPARSVTDGLRRYPDGQLDSPLDVREATLTVRPGNGTAALGESAAIATPGLLTRAEQWLQHNVSGIELTLWVGLLAIGLSMVLGAAHAALPGHGKTVMAIYLAGRAGRRRDALIVGATVTATHTGGVLALGLLLSTTTWLAGETVLSWLGLLSGAVIVAVGITMLRRPHHHPHHHHHHHPHGTSPHTHARHTHAPHDHGASHDHTPHARASHGNAPHSHTSHGHAAHDHSHAHATHGHGLHTHGLVRHAHPWRDHDPGHHAHSHAHATHGHGQAAHAHGHDAGSGLDRGAGGGHGTEVRPGKRMLAALGVAGGLVPSPSALIVLLGSIALGRTGFGILLVLAYGLGMAGTLTLAGLTLLSLRDRFTWLARLLTRAPSATGALVLVVGVALAVRSAAAI
ncbi:hypothetical protein [Catelliglobosispora koreensis]|uniref:hypothetical protein n=1 Tax=Catelliglobosispora koreensis TaxID=129052 RepID=UPI0003750CFA|nr:hypothetical protein [Catelliglobosispora koreensis]